MDKHASERPILGQLLIMIASLVAGTTVWLAVQLTETKEVVLSLPVVPTRGSEYVEVVFDPSTVDVQFSFAVKDSQFAESRYFQLRLDLPDDAVNPARLNLEPRGQARGFNPVDRRAVGSVGEVLRDRRYEVLNVMRQQIGWTATVRRRPIIIRPTIVGKPAEGYSLVPELFNIHPEGPYHVALTAEAAARIAPDPASPIEVRTHPIDVTGWTGPRYVEFLLGREPQGLGIPITLDLPDGVLALPGPGGANPRLSIEIDEDEVTRTFPAVALRYDPLRAGVTAQFDPPTVTVQVRGRKSVVDALRPESILAGGRNIPNSGTAKVPVEAIVDGEARNTLVLTTIPDVATVTILVPEDQARPTPEPLATATPTIPPSPTPTARPTATPSPSPTVSPSPTTAPTPTTRLLLNIFPLQSPAPVAVDRPTS